MVAVAHGMCSIEEEEERGFTLGPSFCSRDRLYDKGTKNAWQRLAPRYSKIMASKTGRAAWEPLL
jgi:hypothetical protein